MKASQLLISIANSNLLAEYQQKVYIYQANGRSIDNDSAALKSHFLWLRKTKNKYSRVYLDNGSKNARAFHPCITYFDRAGSNIFSNS